MKLCFDPSNPPRARVRVFYHPCGRDEGEVQSDFETTGGMIPSGDAFRERGIKGACFFVFPLDYSGLDDAFPRAHYEHLVIAHNFDWKTRRGEYIHIPFGGKIEISAL